MMNRHHARHSGRRATQVGLTLLELMVAMTISLVVILAALAALLFARDAFQTTDTSSQLRENSRFATQLISRVVNQAGFQEVSEANGDVTRLDATISGAVNPTAPFQPDLQGYNNALFVPGTAPAHDSRTSGCPSSSDTRCANGSDVLIVRYQGMNGPNGTSDGSVIDCNGQSAASVTQANQLNNGRATSVFYVDVDPSNNEPSLYCATPSASSSTGWQANPLIEGVESFQVLYGCDQCTANVDPGSAAVLGFPSQWLTAKQLEVTGNLPGTYRNWQRVLAVRIGMVVRSAGVQSGAAAAASQINPYVDSQITGDVGVPLTIPSDNRARQAVSFTVNLRNSLSYSMQ